MFRNLVLGLRSQLGAGRNAPTQPLQQQLQAREFSSSSSRRNTVMRRAAKKAAGTKREGMYEYHPAQIKKWSVFKGDRVEVVVGEDKGLQGLISRVNRLNGVVYLKNVLTKERVVTHSASSLKMPLMKKAPRPFPYDHVKVLDPRTNQPVKVGWKVGEDGSKVRVIKGTDTLIPQPFLTFGKKIVRSNQNTPRADALRITYDKHPDYLKAEQSPSKTW